MKILLLILTLSVCLPACAQEQGIYFAKKHYLPEPIPIFEETKGRLPKPIYEENPLWVETYWNAWEIAFRNFHEPAIGSGFVSQYIDAAFNNCIFMWDTAFMTMFCNYGWPLVPGIGSLDNFYIKQYPNGEICREINRSDGTDCALWVNHGHEQLYSTWGYEVPGNIRKVQVEYRGRSIPKPPPVHTLDNMNHPIMAWAEIESYKVTGDLGRLRTVYSPLKYQYEAFKKYTRQGNGLYMVDWASMDNSARNRFLAGGGTGIDISCEMVLFTNCLAEIASLTGNKKDAAAHKAASAELTGKINSLMWNQEDGFYYDLTLEGDQVGVKTVAAYWSLVSGVADTEKAEALVANLKNPATFGTKNLVPTLAGDEENFSELGDYWCGSVWAPTTTMVIEGLNKYGYHELATEVALNHIELVAKVYEETGTIWENYAPNTLSPGLHADGRPVARDFVGWSGIGPIKLFLEYGIGLKPDASSNTLCWNIMSEQQIGCKDFRFNGNTVSLLAEKGSRSKYITVASDRSFTLKVNAGHRETAIKIKRGTKTYELR